MNHRIAELAAFVERHPLEEKVLVCPSYAAGRQLTDALARSGCPWVGLRVETVSALASGIVGSALSAEGLTTLSGVTQLSLVESALEETESLSASDSYFGKLRGMPGLARALCSTLQDLRLAGLSAGDLQKDDVFLSSRKSGELAEVLENYERLLSEHGFADYPAILTRALLALNQNKSQVFVGARFLVLSELRLLQLEIDLLRAISEEDITLLDHDAVADLRPDPNSARCVLANDAKTIEGLTHEASSLGALFALSPPASAPSQPVLLRRALGETNEVRDALRSMLERGIPFDQVEILHTNTTTYLPRLFEETESHGIPTTFAEGLPLQLTRPGRSLLGFLAWIESDFAEVDLARLFLSGNVDLTSLSDEPAGRKAPGSVRTVRHLREAKIGWGRERYLPALETLRKSKERRLEKVETGSDADDDLRQRKRRSLENTVSEVRCLESFVARLLALVPGDLQETTLSELAASAGALVDEFAPRGNERDELAAVALKTALSDLESVPGARQSIERAGERLREVVASSAVSASSPEPGHLHVSHYLHGGHSGRGELVVLGLDERRFPGHAGQDPILLDEERKRLGGALPLARDRLAAHLYSLTSTLASHRGPITLSFSSRDLLEGNEVLPSSILLQAYRLSSLEVDADYSTLERALPEPAGFLVPETDALNDSEWWLSACQKEAERAGHETLEPAIDAAFPWLGRGRHAERARESAEFTVYDGHLPSAGDSLDFRVSRKATSASGLEKLGNCPYAFFLQYVLGISPPETLERDDELWLDALQFGSLLHKVFECFMAALQQRGELPEVSRHSAELREVAEEKIEKWRNEVPASNDAAVARTRDRIQRSLETFLRNEEQHTKNSAPRYFEVPFGMQAYVKPRQGGLSSPDPIALDVKGRDLYLRGFIDRIDQVGEHDYQIWDYKTGSTTKYAQHRPFAGGRTLQHALYSRAAEKLLGELDPDARVTGAGYFFTGPRGEGERIAYESENLRELEDVLTDLLDVLGKGALAHTKSKIDCTYCDFAAVCGKTGVAADRMSKKLDSVTSGNPLDPYKRLSERKD